MLWARVIGEWVYCSFPEWLAVQIQIVLSQEIWISRVAFWCFPRETWKGFVMFVEDKYCFLTCEGNVDQYNQPQTQNQANWTLSI